MSRRSRANPVASPGATANAESFDVVVLGSGAGGLATAITAADRGLKVLVLERADRCGGATSRSGGWLWAPRNLFAHRDGIEEPIELIEQYLQAALGDDYDATQVRAFLNAAPEMVGFFETRTELKFVPGTKINDIYGELPGAGTGHRSVGPKPLNGRKVPRRLRRILRRQFAETSFAGMGIMAGPDLAGFLSAAKGRPAGLWHATKRVAQYVFDVVTTGQGMHWVNGIALIGRMVLAADRLGVDIRVRHEAVALDRDATGRVIGVTADTPQGRRRFAAARGVVIATGGFSADAGMRRELFPHNLTADDHFTLATPECDGSGIRLGAGIGGVFSAAGASAGAWCPVSLVPRVGGGTGVFPHIMDRAKPGSIGVRADGRRFVNEANGYWDYVDGLNRATPSGERAESWQIADRTFVRRFPLGFAKPWPVPLTPLLRSGYLVSAPTLRELANKCGIDADALEDTVAKFNAAARVGDDPEFGRGRTPFNRYGGDPEARPNPSLAPIERGPFYAVKVRQGTFGTFAGLIADEHSRLLDGAGRPIPGAYVVGVDRKNVFGGHYPAGGVNIGPAMTFGYLAGLDLSRLESRTDSAAATAASTAQ